MTESEIRCAIECREDETRESPGHLRGVLMRYGEIANDRPERFLPDSLRWKDEGILLVRQHNRQLPIVRFTPEVRGNEVLIDIVLPDTAAGRDAATEVRNGTFRGLSVEFIALEHRVRNSLREIMSADLVRAGLVDTPSYSGSTVEVRSRKRRFWL